jgi:hypothetical protein
MILLMVIVSIIFQIIISYVNEEPRFTNFIKDTVITILVQTFFVPLYIFYNNFSLVYLVKKDCHW